MGSFVAPIMLCYVASLQQIMRLRGTWHANCTKDISIHFLNPLIFSAVWAGTVYCIVHTNCQYVTYWGVCHDRDHPEKKLDFTVARGASIVHIPVTPALAADGGGRIGVSLAPNASIVRRAAKGVGEALSLTGSEFSRLLNIVTSGEPPLLHRP